MILLDTHSWVWWLHEDERLPDSLKVMIESATDIAVSSVSVYELTFLASRGRITLTLPLAEWLQEATIESNVMVLPVTATIAAIAGQLPQHHGDPMDRMIIATAIEHQASVLSFDEKFQLYAEIKDQLINRKQQ
jgi:PIN domain nuclease of toxin-antitoxin system